MKLRGIGEHVCIFFTYRLYFEAVLLTVDRYVVTNFFNKVHVLSMYDFALIIN